MWKAILDNSDCSSQPCKAGKELSEKAKTVFKCRHLDLIQTGRASEPESPILCEAVRYYQTLKTYYGGIYLHITLIEISAKRVFQIFRKYTEGLSTITLKSKYF